MKGRRRAVVVVDRVLLTLGGLVLAVAGIALVVAGTGAVRALPDRLDVQRLDTWTRATWWPAATGAAGIVLVVAAVWWWIAHLPGRRPGPVQLSGSEPSARLEVELPAVARAASRRTSTLPTVRSASLALVRERGGLVLVGRVRVSPHASLGTVAADLESVATQTREVLGQETLAARIHLSVGRRDTGRPRTPPR